MKLTNKSILIISPEPWGINRVSKHHYATEFAKLGNQVFFLNPPTNTSQVSYDSEITIIDYAKITPGINRLAAFIRDKVYFTEAKKINKKVNIKSWDIVISFDPFRFQNLSGFNSRHTIFFPVDIHLTKLDKEVAKNVDLVLTTSSVFRIKYQNYAKQIETFNHGLAASFVEFEYNQWTPKEQIQVLYIGNLLKKEIDWDSLTRIVNGHEDISFTFIGPFTPSNLSKTNGKNRTQHLQKCKNVSILGEVESSQLPKFIEEADLFFMSYDSSEFQNEVSNPHKVLEYLSSGKVVVANYTAAYDNSDELIVMAKKQEELPQLFNAVVNNLEYYNSQELSEKRRKFALENTYKRHIEKILNLIED